MSYLEIISTFQARHIMSPLIPDGMLSVGMPMSKGKQQLGRNNFEYGVVRDGHQIVGLVAREDLKGTEDSLPSSYPVKSLEQPNILPDATLMHELISILGVFPFHLVAREKQVIGVVEISDLNKHAVYAYLYCEVSILEHMLSDLIQIYLPDTQMWLPKLDEERQGQIKARRMKAVANNREVDLLYYLMFADYIKIVGVTPEIIKDLGFRSKKEWQKYVGAMDSLRNDVMHPVRDLVGNHRTAEQLARVNERLQSLIARAGQLIPAERSIWHI